MLDWEDQLHFFTVTFTVDETVQQEQVKWVLDKVLTEEATSDFTVTTEELPYTLCGRRWSRECGCSEATIIVSMRHGCEREGLVSRLKAALQPLNRGCAKTDVEIDYPSGEHLESFDRMSAWVRHRLHWAETPSRVLMEDEIVYWFVAISSGGA